MSTYTPSRLLTPSRRSNVDWSKMGMYAVAAIAVYALANVNFLTEPINWLLLIVFVGILLSRYKQILGG